MSIPGTLTPSVCIDVANNKVNMGVAVRNVEITSAARKNIGYQDAPSPHPRLLQVNSSRLPYPSHDWLSTATATLVMDILGQGSLTISPPDVRMEELQKKHRQEHRDLQSRITQKKKNATKKTRKSVNDECTELERLLKEKQESEVRALNGVSKAEEEGDVHGERDAGVLPETVDAAGSPSLNDSMKSVTVSSANANNAHNKKPNRQKARLARRAAEHEAAAEQAEKEAADMPNPREKEREQMREAYESKGLVQHEIRSDGHCLYAAIADQLDHSGIGLSPRAPEIRTDALNLTSAVGYKIAREVAAAYIEQHDEDFVPFLEEPIKDYVHTIRNTGEWGGHLEILALAKAYEANINVLQGDGRVETISCGIERDLPTLWLAYYRHSFGLGEHYNSLRSHRT